VIEIIIADRRNPLFLFIIALGQKIMDNWVHENLVRKERIAGTPIGYTNNDIALQYLNHIIKYMQTGLNKL
jgi:hypothetical protein